MNIVLINIIITKNKINYFFNKQEIKKAKEDKNIIFEEYIQNNNIKLINNFDNFLELLLLNSKKVGIVTLSPLKRVKLICEKIPLLNKITQWITNENELDNKTSLYIKMISKFNNISLDKIIIFEDSLLGFNSIKNLNITKVLINKEKYIYYNNIKCINKFIDYTNITKNINNENDIKINEKINNKINNYFSQVEKIKNNYIKNIQLLGQLILQCKGIIYFLGIGKNNNLIKKCVSIWNSFGLKALSVYVQDLYMVILIYLKKRII